MILLPDQPHAAGGGCGVWEESESARADFNLRELPSYLSNTYEILPLLLKCIGEQDFFKSFMSRVYLVAMAIRFSTPRLVKC